MRNPLPLTILFLCLTLTLTHSGAFSNSTVKKTEMEKRGKLLSDQVNLRKTPHINSQILATLPLGTALDIHSCEKKIHLIGNYYGRWCKVSLIPKGKTTKLSGHLLSSFIESPALPGEKFHLFMNRLDKALQAQDHALLKPLFKSPLSYQVCEEGDCKSEPITFDALLKTLDYRPQAFMYKPSYSYEQGKLSMLYGYEAFYTTFYFALKQEKWQIESVTQTRD